MVGLKPINNEIPNAPDLTNATKLDIKENIQNSNSKTLNEASVNSSEIEEKKEYRAFSTEEELAKDEVHNRTETENSQLKDDIKNSKEHKEKTSTEMVKNANGKLNNKIKTIFATFNKAERSFYKELVELNNSIYSYLKNNKTVPDSLVKRRDSAIKLAINIANDYICNGTDEIAANKTLLMFYPLIPKKYKHIFDNMCVNDIETYIIKCPAEQKIVDANEIITVVAMYM